MERKADPEHEGKRTGPLTHIRVIDLTRFRAGPTCTRQLADLGADVIRVELPESWDAVRQFDHLDIHHNKRSLGLNLKQRGSREVIRRLAVRSDVLVENYRPEVKERLGFDYPTLRELNPRLIYCSLSGFGQRGPYRDRAGYDQIAQGMSGIMSVTGSEDTGPLRVGIPVGDLCAGLYAAIGVLAALVERERSGKGQWVETSLLEALVGMLSFQAARYLILGEQPPPVGNHHPLNCPMGVYPAKDGLLNLAVGTPSMWERFCQVLKVPELADDPRFRTNDLRVEHREELDRILEQLLRQKRVAEWVETLNAAGVASGPIYDVAQVFSDPQVEQLDMVAEVSHPSMGTYKVVGSPVKLSRTPGSIHAAAPFPGQHSYEILEWLGFTQEEIEELARSGATGAAYQSG